MDQVPLFRLAVEAVQCSAIFEPGSGWRVRIAARRQGESWVDSTSLEFERLSTHEMLDTVERAFDSVLSAP